MAQKRPNLPDKSGSADVDRFLRTVAQTPPPQPEGRGRLIFALDATASRGPTWDRACEIQGQMFIETGALGGLEVQMVYYRGFGEFEAAPWATSAEDMVRRMTGVYCLGGHTQIGKVLAHATRENKRKKVNALVFVGDCVEEDVDDLCAMAGELGLRGVPAFIFQEGDEPTATQAFKQIVRLTHGAHCRFDLSSAKQLRDLLSAVAVYAAGGRKALENYGRRAGSEVRQLASQIK